MHSRRLAVLKGSLWTLVGVLASVTAVRLVHGLGAVTNLSDGVPWGLWAGFKMSCVALSAGGFVLAATVYIFGLERYRPFVRAAVLTALLGYVTFVVCLLYDLGIPWRIWHPMIHWQYHSVLFEVGMCVMLYLTVLSLEFAPVVLEHRLFDRPLFRSILRFLKRVTIPLVIAGIVLSTLHQSSLGSLFLIAPYRLHPLWYSPIIYVLFFVSAVGLGLMVVVLESIFSSYFLDHEIRVREMSELGVVASGILWFYLVLRLGDLALRGVLGTALDGSGHSLLFFLEIGLSAVLPATLLLFRRVRSSLHGLGVCAALTASGMVLYRMSVSILSFARPDGVGYFPSWEEFAISVGILAATALVFIFFVEHLKVYGDVGGSPLPEPRPGFAPSTADDLMPRVLAAPRRNTGAALAGAALALLFLPLGGAEPVRTPTSVARQVVGVVRTGVEGEGGAIFLAGADRGNEADDPERKLLLMIDGNRNGDLVLFDHDGHKERLGDDTSCGMCHHLGMPFDRATGCFECHRDMYDSTSVFDHGSHVTALGGNAGCSECHSEEAEVKRYETATACMECHRHELSASLIIAPPQERWRAAPSYIDAMHHLCIACHHQKLEESPERHRTGFDQCIYCHDTDRRYQLLHLMPARTGRVRKGGAKVHIPPLPGERE